MHKSQYAMKKNLVWLSLPKVLHYIWWTPGCSQSWRVRWAEQRSYCTRRKILLWRERYCRSHTCIKWMISPHKHRRLATNQEVIYWENYVIREILVLLIQWMAKYLTYECKMELTSSFTRKNATIKAEAASGKRIRALFFPRKLRFFS